MAGAAGFRKNGQFYWPFFCAWIGVGDGGQAVFGRQVFGMRNPLCVPVFLMALKGLFFKVFLVFPVFLSFLSF